MARFTLSDESAVRKLPCATTAMAAASELTDLDAVVLAVPHRGLGPLALELIRAGTPVLSDVKCALSPADLPAGVRYWRL